MRSPTVHTDEVARSNSARVYRVSARLPVEDLGELFDPTSMTTRWRPSVVWSVCGSGGLPLPGAEVEAEGLLLIAEGGPNHQGRQRITTVLVRRGAASRRGRRSR